MNDSFHHPRWKQSGTERSRNFTKVTQLANDRSIDQTSGWHAFMPYTDLASPAPSCWILDIEIIPFKAIRVTSLVLLLHTVAAAKSLQSCPTLCNPRDGSPPGSPVPGILQARTLEWVAISLSNAWEWKVKVKSLSCVWLPATPWTAAYQAPLSMGFSRQEYWSGVPLPSPLLHTGLHTLVINFIRWELFSSYYLLNYLCHFSGCFLGQLVNPEGMSLENIQQPMFLSMVLQLHTCCLQWSPGPLVTHTLCRGRMSFWAGWPRMWC